MLLDLQAIPADATALRHERKQPILKVSHGMTNDAVQAGQRTELCSVIAEANARADLGAGVGPISRNRLRTQVLVLVAQLE